MLSRLSQRSHQLLYQISFMKLCQTLHEIEVQPSSIKKQATLLELLKSVNQDEGKQILNFCLCEPNLLKKSDHAEVVVSENIIIAALASQLNIPIRSVATDARQYRDICEFALDRCTTPPASTELQLTRVFQIIDSISGTNGFGSELIKQRMVKSTLEECSHPLEVKYFLRFLTKKMRIGLSKRSIEKVLMSLGGDFTEMKTQVLAYQSNDQVVLGVPILPTLAQSFDSPQEIANEFMKTPGQYSCEFKYDGERIQVHYDSEKVELFSRSMEKRAWKYPYLTSRLEAYLKNQSIESIVLDCEMICLNLDGSVQAFQDLMSTKQVSLDISLVCFDLLYYQNEPQMSKTLLERQQVIKSLFSKPGEPIIAVEQVVVVNENQIEEIFTQALERGLEGVIVKRNTAYMPGSRTTWAKLKKQRDADLALIGAYWGRGKRNKYFGAFLLAAIDQNQRFTPITKIGTGFSEEELRQLTERIEPLADKPPNINQQKVVRPDVWITPKEVWEIRYDTITTSPNYQIRSSQIGFFGGLSYRFPRFFRLRTDKLIDQCTTVDDVNKLMEIDREAIPRATEANPLELI